MRPSSNSILAVLVYFSILSLCFAQNSSNTTNTSSPTTLVLTLAPTLAPTSKTPTVAVAPTVNSFDRQMARNANIDGSTTYFAFYAMMYISVTIGPAYFVLFILGRMYARDDISSKIPIRIPLVVCLFAGWPIFLITVLIQAFGPEDYTVLIFCIADRKSVV